MRRGAFSSPAACLPLLVPNLLHVCTACRAPALLNYKAYNIVNLGLWAQRLSKKPVDWIWSGSHKRTEAFVEAMRTTAFQSGIPFNDTYAMTLPMLEFNVDGVHFNERVTRALAMLLTSVMTEGLVRSA